MVNSRSLFLRHLSEDIFTVNKSTNQHENYMIKIFLLNFYKKNVLKVGTIIIQTEYENTNFASTKY